MDNVLLPFVSFLSLSSLLIPSFENYSFFFMYSVSFLLFPFVLIFFFLPSFPTHSPPLPVLTLSCHYPLLSEDLLVLWPPHSFFCLWVNPLLSGSLGNSYIENELGVSLWVSTVLFHPTYRVCMTSEGLGNNLIIVIIVFPEIHSSGPAYSRLLNAALQVEFESHCSQTLTGISTTWELLHHARPRPILLHQPGSF